MHSGFDKAWRNNGLNRRVLDRVQKIFQDGEVDKLKCRILVTGMLPILPAGFIIIGHLCLS